MFDRSRTLVALAMLTTLLVGACNSTPPVVELTDPKEILTKSVATIQKAKTFHFDATVDGTLNIDMFGAGEGTEIALEGTSAQGDLDLAGKNMRITAAVPAFLGLRAEVIVVGEDTYTKTSLSGAKFKKSSTSSSAEELPVDATDPTKALGDFATFLAKPEIAPTKGPDVDCGNATCYQVLVELTADELAALSSPAPSATASASPFEGTVNITVTINKSTLQLYSITADMTDPKQGELSLVATFTKWDAPLTISAPPAEEVEPSIR